MKKVLIGFVLMACMMGFTNVVFAADPCQVDLSTPHSAGGRTYSDVISWQVYTNPNYHIIIFYNYNSADWPHVLKVNYYGELAMGGHNFYRYTSWGTDICYEDSGTSSQDEDGKDYGWSWGYFYNNYPPLDTQDIHSTQPIYNIDGSGVDVEPDLATIAQGPLSASPGQVLVQWGNGFSPNSTATLHFTKPGGVEYPTAQQPTDSVGHFEVRYTVPYSRPSGTYTWWGIDDLTGRKSNVISYQVTGTSGVGTVSGTLHRNSTAGPVLSGAEVTCGIKSGITITHGTFTLSKIPAGDQVLRFSKAGYQPFSLSVHIPDGGSVHTGERWLVQNGITRPTIAQAPMAGPPGSTFIDWGTAFTSDGTATLHFKKPDGSQYPPQKVALNSRGHFELPYRTTMTKSKGIYTWWAIDDVTGKKSNEVSYEITQPLDPCNAPTKDKALMKVTPSCRDLWNLTIFYNEIYNCRMQFDQRIIKEKIDGVLTANTMANAAIEVFSSLKSLYEIPQLAGKDFYYLFGVGASESLAFESKIIGNEYANIWLGALGAATKVFMEGGNPEPVLEYGIKTGLTTINNLLATIGVTTLTKRFQEIEIAKQFLLGFYARGSRMQLLAVKYGLPSDASMITILEAIADKIGADNPWYWFAEYDINRVVDHVVTNLNVVAIKQIQYSK